MGKRKKRKPVLVVTNGTGHNYLKKLNQLIGQGILQTRPGVLSDVKIEHDEWCNIFRGGECNCDPTLTVRHNVTMDELVEHSRESAESFKAMVERKKL
jgi:hypothetical protein